jgi:exodeoxyribonuclease VII large subunit
VQRVDGFVAGLDQASARVIARGRQRMAVADRELTDAARRVRRSATIAVEHEHTRLDRAHGRLDELARRRTAELGARLDACARRVDELGRRAVRDRRAALELCGRRLATHAQHHLERTTLRLAACEAVVRALDPRQVLERGYSITRDADGRVLRATAAVRAGAVVETELVGGRFTSRVEAIIDHTTEEDGD